MLKKCFKRYFGRMHRWKENKRGNQDGHKFMAIYFI